MAQHEEPAAGRGPHAGPGEIEDTNGIEEPKGEQPGTPGAGPGPTTQGGIEDTGVDGGDDGDGGGEESNP